MDSMYERMASAEDLIDTLWNVKFSMTENGLSPLVDLIDTLWNVKEI